MIRFYRQLYVSPNIKNVGLTKWRIRHHAGDFGGWVIIPAGDSLVSSPGENQLELLHCANLQLKYYRRQRLMIVGVAEGRWQAIQLVGRIVSDCVAATGKTDLKAYLFPECQHGQFVKPWMVPVMDVASPQSCHVVQVSANGSVSKS